VRAEQDRLITSDQSHGEPKRVPISGDFEHMPAGRPRQTYSGIAGLRSVFDPVNARRWLCGGVLLTLATVALPVSAQDQDASSASVGERLFDSYCSACHQYDDQGMGEAPPLEASPWVVGPSERLVRILLHGISGRIEIGGRVYDREMPGFGRILSDRDAAALATYTRQRFGADEPSVTPAEVKRIRDEHADRTAYWPADELLELR